MSPEHIPPIRQDDDFDSEVLEFLEKRCEALQAGLTLSPSVELVAKHPELAELLQCLGELESFAVLIGTLSNNASSAEQTSSLMQRLPREFGSFQLEAELGRGGMGVVYKARHRTLESYFALKIIRSSEFASNEEVRRFFQEARAASRLQHPHIVSVHDAGEQEGVPFLVMTYIDGETLATRLQRGKLALDVAVEIMIQISKAVAYLHEQEMIHRDLKPSNIILDQRDTAFVTDFGLAKVFNTNGEQTATGTILGTPAYMSPEQAWGNPLAITGRSDIYSLGAIFYEMLSSQPPFQEDSPLNQILRLRDSEPKPLRKFDSKIPVDVEQICMRCLEKDPKNRYANATEFIDDLICFRNGEPITVPSRGLSANLRRWSRREPALAVHVTALLIIALIIQLTEWLAPRHRENHLAVMLILGLWLLVSVTLQKLIARGVPFMRRAWIAGDVILFTAAIATARGPFESLVAGYALLIVASSMWYKPTLVAVTTASTVASYLYLLVSRGSPETPPLHPYLVVGILLVTGGVTISLVRRIRQLLLVRSRL